MKTIRAKIPYKKLVKTIPITGTFYRTDLVIGDNFKDFPIYCRNLPQYYVDIPTGTNQLGIIYKGFFCKVGDFHPNTLDAIDYLKKLSNKLIETKYSILDNANKMIEQHKQTLKGE